MVIIAEAKKLTGCSDALLDKLEQAGALVRKEEDHLLEEAISVKDERFQLTDEQQSALDKILHPEPAREKQPVLLYGVTGSGKTLVYMEAAEQVIQQGKQVLILLPEISLTPQLAARFRKRFPNVVVWHSGFSDGERAKSWRDVQSGAAQLVVGTRSALFAPLPDIGLIIVDEEHDGSYKQDSTPRYHGRDLAIAYAHQRQCPIVLGSATPSCETILNARSGRYVVAAMKQRPAGSTLPEPHIVDMREEYREQKQQVVLSKQLIHELQLVKQRGEQAVVLLNRRGWSSFVACPSCGYVFNCESCDISLTYHRHDQRLRCHYCGHEQEVPKNVQFAGDPFARSWGWYRAAR